MTTIINANSTTLKYGYNNDGDVISTTDERNNVTTYSFDAMNRETGTTNALGGITTYTYDSGGNLIEDQEPTPSGQTARTTYYAYDSMNRPTTITDPLGYQTVYKYDGDGNLISTTDPMGRITTTTYNALNQAVVVEDPMGNLVTTTYDAEGEKLTVTDALGRTTTYTYSVRGWLATETDPMGYIATYTYTPTGKNSGTYQLQGFEVEVSALTYNADDELVTSENGLSDVTSYSYDGIGNVIAVIDPNGHTTSYSYNSMDQLTTVTNALGETTVYGYDSGGNQQTVTDGLGHTTTTLYDALNRATTVISATSGTTVIAYDIADRETSLTDPDSNITTWAYNADDEVTTLTQANGGTVTYVYDDDGELTDTTDADGHRTTYSYNADGDNTGETWVGASPSEKITYTYDADNELTGAADSFATLTFTYSADGELATDATSGPGSGQPSVTLTYSYDQLGDETSVTDSLSSAGVTSYTYNAAQQLTLITTTYGGTAGPQVSFNYDSGGLLTSTSRQVGSSTEATEVNTTVTYNAADEVVTMTSGVSTYNFFPPGWSTSPVATYAYSYDSGGRVTTMVSGSNTYTYTYDNSNELTGVDENGTQVNSYAYDANGNRTGTGYSTTVMNETLTSPGGITYTYNKDGNMISSDSGGTITTYVYDYRNRLTQVEQGGTVIASYTYNALNQRIAIDDNGTRTWTIYDGTSPDAEPYADFNSSGTLTERYLHGPGVVNGVVTPVLLARTSSGGSTAWYLTDKLDSVTNIVSSSGSVLDTIVYDAFGNILSESSPSNGDRFKFAGMQLDATTGQYFDNARWYGPVTGRFAALDPVGFASGDFNPYRYAGGSPLNVVDTTGLTGVSGAMDPNLLSSMLPGIEMSLQQMSTTIQSASTSLVASAAAMASGAIATTAAGAQAIAGVIASSAVAMGALTVTAVAEAGYAYYLLYELSEAGGEYVAASIAGAILDAQIRAAQLRMVLTAAAAQMAAANENGVMMAEAYEGEFEELAGYVFMKVAGQLDQPPDPNIDPNKWKEMVERTFKAAQERILTLLREFAKEPPPE